MRHLHIALIAALAAPAALAASPHPAAAQQTQTQAQPTYQDVGLDWARGPSVRDMARFYRTTRHDGRRGVATVWCTPDADGRLSCDVLDEYPTDRQFGLAGVRVMERARVVAVDGTSPAGRSFAFTLRFGNWPASALPDRFQPISQNLRWVERPTLVGEWAMQGQNRGDRIAATVDCRARATGALDCSLVSADTPEFGEAALRGMGYARVERIDSGDLEGSPLRWTLAVERQSGCGTGGGGRGGSYPSMTSGTSPSVTDALAAGESGGFASSSTQSGQTANSTNGGMPGCQSAMVQVVGN